jgi:hypothetical protein
VLCLLCLIAPAAAPAEDRAKADDADRVLVVTRGHPRFQHRGVFYPAGMDAAELVRRFGEPDVRASERQWRYEKRRVTVGVGGRGPKDVSFMFVVRDPTREDGPPATHVVTDSGIDHRSTPADVVKAHGEPTLVRTDEADGRKLLRYASRGGQVGSVSFRFKGDTLEVIQTTVINGSEPAPRATTVPAAATRPSR